MRYAKLGNTGLIVSRLAFGAMTFTAGDRRMKSIFKTEPAVANALVGRALDAGINFFDTADIYAFGQSEQILGAALKGRRDEVVIATKAGVRSGANLLRAGLSRRHIQWSVDQSLKRLGTDWIEYISPTKTTCSHRSKKRWQRSTQWCKPARSATSVFQIGPPGK